MGDKLKDTAKKYSQFIQFPIYVKIKKEVDADAEEEEDDDDDDEDEDKDDVETSDDDEKEEEEEKKPTKKTVYEWEQVNTQKAIWLRNKEDVTEEEYNEFYKGISRDYLDPLAYTHFNAEGEIEFKSILFLPKKAPFDMMDNYWTKRSEVKLYVRRVLVAEMFDELLPRYLGFVRGVVDSDDLPLNVSREQLQQNKIMKVISKKLVRKVLELMKKLAKDEESGDDEDDEKDDDEEKSKDGSEEKEEKKGAMKDAGVKIEKVELSKRLTDSPVVVVTSQFGYSAQQEKIMKAQAFQNKDQMGMMAGRK